MTDHLEPLHKPQRKKSRIETTWESLPKQAQQFTALAGAVVVIVGMTRGCDSVAKMSDLAAMKSAQAQVDAKQDEKIADVNGATNLLFQTTVRLSTQMEAVTKGVDGTREDLRRMDRGQPLPTITPSPTPKIPTP